MKPHRTTQRDIAAHLGVHVTTVSMALRHHPSLPSATIERVKAVADKLSYLPDPALSALMDYRRNVTSSSTGWTLAYLTSWPERDAWRKHPPHVRFYEGASRRAGELGYQFEHVWLREAGVTSARWSQILHARNYAGWIVAPLPVGRGHLRLSWEKACAVKIDSSMVWPPLHGVGNNQIQIMRLAIRQAMHRGYRHMGFASRRANNERVDRFWTAAYLDEVERLGSPKKIPPHLPSQLERREFLKWFRRWKPDLVLSQDHRLPEWLEGDGVQIPDEVGFINLDRQAAQATHAGVCQEHEAVGGAAVNMLDLLIRHNERGIPAISQLTLLEGRWTEGGTIRPASSQGLRPTKPVSRPRSPRSLKPTKP